MKPCLRIWLPLVIVLGVPGSLQAQNPETSANSARDPGCSVAQKPKRKPDQVITNDPIALLAVRRTPPVIVASSEQSSKKEASGVGLDQPSKKAAEIASLEQQIRERQNRITLLLRLFVNDEKAFVIDPSNANADALVTERRQYEQDELRWETAELAKFKARLKELTGNGEGR